MEMWGSARSHSFGGIAGSRAALNPTYRYISWNEDARSGGGAAFQVAVRLGDVLEGVALVDRDLHLAAGHHAEQVVGDRQQILALGRIGIEGRTSGEERALGLQDIDAEGLDRAGGVAKAHEHAERLDAIERGRECGLADAVID